MRLLRHIPLAFVAAALTSGTVLSGPQTDLPPDLLIGYTEHRTDRLSTWLHLMVVDV